jgi:hypothetical protein
VSKQKQVEGDNFREIGAKRPEIILRSSEPCLEATPHDFDTSEQGLGASCQFTAATDELFMEEDM